MPDTILCPSCDYPVLLLNEEGWRPTPHAYASVRGRMVTRLEPEGWVYMPVMPRQRYFRQHLGHGLLMGYPLPAILAFCWRNRGSARAGTRV